MPADLRRLPAQPATEGKATPAVTVRTNYGAFGLSMEDVQNAFNEIASIGFGRPPAPKPDPYETHRRGFAAQSGAVTDADVAELTAGYEAGGKARRRFTADQIGSIDLDRPLTPPRYPTRNRGACLGVMGTGAGVKRREGKGAPSTWPEGSDNE
jgi:hypothetical protein